LASDPRRVERHFQAGCHYWPPRRYLMFPAVISIAARTKFDCYSKKISRCPPLAPTARSCDSQRPTAANPAALSRAARCIPVIRILAGPNGVRCGRAKEPPFEQPPRRQTAANVASPPPGKNCRGKKVSARKEIRSAVRGGGECQTSPRRKSSRQCMTHRARELSPGALSPYRSWFYRLSTLVRATNSPS
jgi:hypothetical protein